MRARIKLLIPIIISILLFSGCYSYRDINKVIFVTSMLIDMDENDNIIVYGDTLRPYRDAGESSERGQRGFYKGEGKSLLEAISDMSLSASFMLDFSQNKAIIFSQKAAESGIDKYMDYLNRAQELNVRAYLFVYYGDIEKLMTMTASNEDYLGNFLNDIVNKVGASSKTIFLNVNDYLTEKRIGSGITVLTALELEEEAGEEKLHLVGGGVIQHGKLVDRLEEKEVMNYNLLTGRVNRGIIEVPNPSDKDNLITLGIDGGSTSTKLELKNGKAKLIKKIKLKGIIGEAQGELKLTVETMDKIVREAKETLIYSTEAFYNEYNRKGLDILNLTREMEKQRISNDHIHSLKNIKLEVYPEVILRGSTNIQNTN
ncbi:Ger(x)C family spore germination protein [Alloiococcus sp. CFN-8]|uniref:Ger(x)C family spore germination protein n=1 Tax=Alloiococcus sp. CFN-8 TaxID=3416081 RepID=UPI003CEFE372